MESGIEALLPAVSGMARRFASKFALEFDDVCQEAIVRTIEHLNNGCPEDAVLGRTWNDLRHLARDERPLHYSAGEGRWRGRRETEVLPEDVDEALDRDVAPESAFASWEAQRDVDKAVATGVVSERERDVLLWHAEGATHAEIASILGGVGRRRVGQILAQARRAFREWSGAG